VNFLAFNPSQWNSQGLIDPIKYQDRRIHLGQDFQNKGVRSSTDLSAEKQLLQKIILKSHKVPGNCSKDLTGNGEKVIEENL
jgi:hypothetical protein